MPEWIQRTFYLGVGFLMGYSFRRADYSELPPSTIAAYVVAGILIIAARLAVVRHRERKEL